MIPLGSRPPAFSLPDVRTGADVCSSELPNLPLLVIFMCRHCPYVVHIGAGLATLGEDYRERVAIIGISSNDAASYPDDSPASLAEFADSLALGFPLLYDETQEVARAFSAACTPDFFLFDGDHGLVYRGQFDDSRPSSSRPVTGASLRTALDAVVAGEPVGADQRPSIGCNIKWKS